MELKELYDKDFYTWTTETAKALRKQAFNQVDLEHLIEEIESMGKSDFRELKSRISVLIAHLLKWQYQNKERSSSWVGTIVEQRAGIDDVLQDSPSLKSKVSEITDDNKIYSRAVKIAASDTGIPQNTFPKTCPYSVNQLLDDDFYPNEL